MANRRSAGRSCTGLWQAPTPKFGGEGQAVTGLKRDLGRISTKKQFRHWDGYPQISIAYLLGSAMLGIDNNTTLDYGYG